MNQRNIRLDLSFNGSAYKGWQKQKNAPSIQHALEKALSKTFQENIRTIGIGRTDAGAHAFFYTASFQTQDLSIPCGKLPRIINRYLPEDIAVLGAAEVPGSFHARYSALAREYVYFAVNGTGPGGKTELPLARNLAYYTKKATDVSKLKKVCRVFRGKHDFRNFCYCYDIRMDFRREIFYFRFREIKLLNSSVTVFFITGNCFLKGMIRSIISACLSCANGDISLDTVRLALKGEKGLDAKYRAPVPASGLYFKRGFYKYPVTGNTVLTVVPNYAYGTAKYMEVLYRSFFLDGFLISIFSISIWRLRN